MSRFLIFTLIVLSIACSENDLPRHKYYGVMNMDGYRRRFIFDNTGDSSRLTLIGFRGYELPIGDVSFVNDTLRFSRRDIFSGYEGRYNPENGVITGRWISEDSVDHPLNFIPALTDTVVGLNPRTVSAYTYISPTGADDGIDVCSRDSVRLSASVIDSLVFAIMKMEYGYIHSMLIARKNCLAVEEYFFGYKREAYFGIQSATKSFVSALTGIALSKGEISTTQAPLCLYLPPYRDLLCNEQNKTITLHDALSMSTGLAWDEVTHDYGDGRNSADIASAQPDPFRYLLSQPRSREKVFAYNSLNHSMMSRVLMQATHLDNAREFRERLLIPLGISHYDLGEAADGIIGDIFLRPRDMLKFGLLYSNLGRWNGHQIVPASWITESTTPKIMIEEGLGYGYFWWTKQFSWKNKTVDSYFAWGYGGQYIFVVPELELVVVFNGTNWSTDPKAYYFDIMQRYIIAACDNDR